MKVGVDRPPLEAEASYATDNSLFADLYNFQEFLLVTISGTVNVCQVTKTQTLKFLCTQIELSAHQNQIIWTPSSCSKSSTVQILYKICTY